jgi:hypothetical protein
MVPDRPGNPRVLNLNVRLRLGEAVAFKTRAMTRGILECVANLLDNQGADGLYAKGLVAHHFVTVRKP